MQKQTKTKATLPMSPFIQCPKQPNMVTKLDAPEGSPWVLCQGRCQGVNSINDSGRLTTFRVYSKSWPYQPSPTGIPYHFLCFPTFPICSELPTSKVLYLHHLSRSHYGLRCPFSMTSSALPQGHCSPIGMCIVYWHNQNTRADTAWYHKCL